ncbi:MAG: S9 family peptidase [Rhodothermaceae bacterium]|nr:S9 family peptidase [Rhodothermaceae bacterium]
MLRYAIPVFTVLLFTIPPINIQAQTTATATVSAATNLNLMPAERYRMANRMLSWKLNGKVYNSIIQPEWIHEQALWYRVNTKNGNEYFLADVAGSMKEPLFDQQKLAANLQAQARGNMNDGGDGNVDSRNGNDSKTDGDSNGIDPYSLPISDIEVSTDLTTVRFVYDNHRWSLNRGTGELTRGNELPALRPGGNYVMSPGGRYAAFIRDHNLWLKDMHSGEDMQLTTEGEAGYGFATDSQGWSRSNRPVLAWSADETMISTYRLDERMVEEMHLLRTTDGRPELVSWPYALPGDEHVPMHERYVIKIPEQCKVKLQTQLYHQRTSNCCGLTRGSEWADNEFSPGNETLAYVATSRDYKEVTLKLADTRTGAVREVFAERDEMFIETNLTSRGVPNWRVLHGSGEFIWFSRNSNWGHLYLHDLETGELKNAITTGEWNVVDIIRVDVDARKIWFTAAGMNPDEDPYEDYLYSTGFNGSGLQAHTPVSGHHQVTLSPDAGHFVDTFSDVQNAPVTVVRDSSGAIVMELEQADISEVLAEGWQKPEPFVTKARDGETDIYGLMFKPSDFDPSKKYPVINSIYPGPQTGSIGTRAFSVSRRGQAHALAELGFIVVQIDAMGTPKRSRDFHTAYYGEMADNGLPDQIAAMQELARRHSWIDINRAGIYGHSGGGFATAAAMFTHPDFFKVGVAGAGNLDNRGYTYYWGEKFQGSYTVLDEDRDSYTNQALQYQVENLRGKLMLSYGTMDSNVHPNMTNLVINELIRHNKDFDLVVMPNRGHGYGNESYKIRRTWDYFVMHLLGLVPPREYDIER